VEKQSGRLVRSNSSAAQQQCGGNHKYCAANASPVTATNISFQSSIDRHYPDTQQLVVPHSSDHLPVARITFSSCAYPSRISCLHSGPLPPAQYDAQAPSGLLLQIHAPPW
jgi:hypothetical protein